MANTSTAGCNAHSVAADAILNQVDVPIPAGANTICGSPGGIDANGCIDVFTAPHDDRPEHVAIAAITRPWVMMPECFLRRTRTPTVSRIRRDARADPRVAFGGGWYPTLARRAPAPGGQAQCPSNYLT